MAPIAVGDKIPDGKLFYLNSDGKPTAFPVYESLKGKKVVLVAAPGAFTPTCSLKHIPSFLDNAEAIRAKGVDEILVLTGLMSLLSCLEFCFRWFGDMNKVFWPEENPRH
jgi:peroxiredoxin